MLDWHNEVITGRRTKSPPFWPTIFKWPPLSWETHKVPSRVPIHFTLVTRLRNGYGGQASHFSAMGEAPASSEASLAAKALLSV
jgi:hypothetical protein